MTLEQHREFPIRRPRGGPRRPPMAFALPLPSRVVAREPYTLSEGVQEFAIKAHLPKKLGLTGQPHDCASWPGVTSGLHFLLRARRPEQDRAVESKGKEPDAQALAVPVPKRTANPDAIRCVGEHGRMPTGIVRMGRQLVATVLLRQLELDIPAAG